MLFFSFVQHFIGLPSRDNIRNRIFLLSNIEYLESMENSNVLRLETTVALYEREEELLGLFLILKYLEV
ncbi:hypothetical protein Y032_0095g2864 [Ancylostoma ceylanicum]|uniref:Uncharacterized protein n=1 Tax=Ancylostoma ceylanicum TaxID=53326 RepID=A0A016TJY4_9BILA|nr:hypothetical protein Y032_0095g2864 [Ancylostoma ceylanicum]